jgi:hypothetical protein
MQTAHVPREAMVDQGLSFIRRREADTTAYFIANHTDHEVDNWIPLAAPGRAAILLDPMTGRTGLAPTRLTTAALEVYLQLLPGETRVLRALPEVQPEGPAWPVWAPAGEDLPVTGPWRVTFVEGGPELPQPYASDVLQSWTESDDAEAQRFAGAARYSTDINIPQHQADTWFLQLGDVRESARVSINSQPVGVVIAHPFRLDVGEHLRPGRNTLEVEVTNLSANRIRDLDRRGVKWKKFHDINLVDHNYKRFDASGWPLKPSGLLGPVTLTPCRRIDPATQ